MHRIYTTELELNPSVTAWETVVHPVDLKDLQKSLRPRELLLEYVLSSPRSYVLAITDKTVTPYTLPSKVQIEADAQRYLGEIHSKKLDVALAQTDTPPYGDVLQPLGNRVPKGRRAPGQRSWISSNEDRLHTSRRVSSSSETRTAPSNFTRIKEDMAVSIKERAAIIHKIEASVRDKFYDPSFDETAWHSIRRTL